MIILVSVNDNEMYAFYYVGRFETHKAICGWAYKQARDMGYAPDTATQLVRDNITFGTPFEYDTEIFDHYVNKNSVVYWMDYYKKYFDVFKAPKYKTSQEVFRVH